MQLGLNPVYHSRMKHMAINLKFIHDIVNKRYLNGSPVNIHDQLADLLIKILSHNFMHYSETILLLLTGTPIFQGHIKEINYSPSILNISNPKQSNKYHLPLTLNFALLPCNAHLIVIIFSLILYSCTT